MKLEGKAPLGPPPYIQNEPEYFKLAQETIIDAQLKCKIQNEHLNHLKKLINTRRDIQREHEILKEFKPLLTQVLGINEYLKQIEPNEEKYAIALSLEPTAEEINEIPHELEKKSTELEITLMDLKVMTQKYTKGKKIIQKHNLRDENLKLNKADENNDEVNAQLIREKIKRIEEEHLDKD